MIPKNPLRFFLFAFLLIGIDQVSKLAVHHYMQPGFAGQINLIGNWFKLHYVLNPGMAFGMQLSHSYGKLILSLFRLVAMAGIGWYLVHLARQGAPNGLLWAMAMILAGAVGNVIDSTFYGVLLDNAPYGSPTPWFHGQVIDMIFVDVWEGFIPDWVPLWGGQYYSTPIFNFADACIFVGVCLILFFQRRFFRDHAFDPEAPAADEVAEENAHDNTTQASPAFDQTVADEVDAAPVAGLEGQPAPELREENAEEPAPPFPPADEQIVSTEEKTRPADPRDVQ